MRMRRYSEQVIMDVLEKHKTGYTIEELSRAYRISPSTIYAWKIRFGDVPHSELSTVMRLENENRRLRRRIAEMIDETDRLKGIIRTDQVANLHS